MGAFTVLSSLLISVSITNAAVLSDLSGGYAHSWTFGTDISGSTLRAIGLDGGLLPSDGNSSNNYLMELSLAASFDLTDGSAYKLSKLGAQVPVLKDQALWSNEANSTLFSYGGRGASLSAADNGIWTYDVAGKAWSLSTASIRPIRYEAGASVNAKPVQNAYWLGGYQDSDTTTSITDKSQSYSTGMVSFNTSTQQVSQLKAPFAPVQNGALVHIPIGEQGVLVFIGGETPASQSGVNITATPNHWSSVWVYDIAGDKWYNQTTSYVGLGGPILPRTQFCTTVAFDQATRSYQIYAMGGADYESQEARNTVTYLSIPSFQWFTAGDLTRPILSLSCEMYGPQILGIGGRAEWTNGFGAGTYGTPGLLYHTGQEQELQTFNPSARTYNLPASAASQIHASPTPLTWADPALRNVLLDSAASSSTTHSTSEGTSQRSSLSGGDIAGIVVGSIVAVALLVLLVVVLVRRRSKTKKEQSEAFEKSELSGDSSYQPGYKPIDQVDAKYGRVHNAYEMHVPPSEAPSHEMRHEMAADTAYHR